jgi:hypothetical protein
MPEPADGQKADDPWDRDVANPFETSDGHATIKDKMRFIGVPALLTMHRTWMWLMVGNHDFGKRYVNWVLMDMMITLCGPIGTLTVSLGVRQLRYLGIRPEAFSFRTTFLGMVFMGIILTTSCMPMMETPQSCHLFSTHEWDQCSDDMVNRANFLICGLITMSCITPSGYRDYSAFGRYCCAVFPRIRLGRCFGLGQFFGLLGYLFMKFFLNASTEPGAFGEFVVPLLVFAWKRLNFTIDITLSGHDSPFKGHCLIQVVLDTMLSLNLQITVAQVGVLRWSDVINYLLIDWVLFTLRVGVLIRVGMNSCPKLVTFMVSKQLENMPAPMPAHEEAVGPKSAMRVIQAFLCILEGETLSIMYLVHVLHLLILFVIAQRRELLGVAPLGSMGLVLTYVGLDIIQDLIADKVANRFSTWTFMYTAGYGSFFSKPFWIPVCMICASQGAQWIIQVGPRRCLLDADASRVAVAHPSMAWSAAGQAHY